MPCHILAIGEYLIAPTTTRPCHVILSVSTWSHPPLLDRATSCYRSVLDRIRTHHDLTVTRHAIGQYLIHHSMLKYKILMITQRRLGDRDTKTGQYTEHVHMQIISTSSQRIHGTGCDLHCTVGAQNSSSVILSSSFESNSIITGWVTVAWLPG